MTEAGKSARAPLFWVPLAAALFGLLLSWPPLAERLSRPLTDWQQRRLAPTEPPAGVLVFDIDDASLQALRPLLGPWPFKRDAYALMVEHLREFGATAIVIDLLLGDAHEGDPALARAIARPGAPVVLAAAGLRHPHDIGSPAQVPVGVPLAANAPPAQQWPALLLPSETVWPSPTQPPRLGVITTPLDDDGLLRRLPLWHAWHTQRLPTMPLAVWAANSGDAPPPADWPLDDEGRALLVFAGGAGSAPVRPFAQLARVALGQESPQSLTDAVRGRVVFIGSSALLADSVMTVSGQLRGTAVLAQSYAALRDGHLLRPPAAWAQALLLAVGLLPALWTWRRGSAVLWRDGAAALLGVAAVVGLGGAFLWRLQMPLPWLTPLGALLAGFVAAVVARQLWLAQKNRQLAYERAVAEAANRAKSEFLANVSHEIRTPMNALLGVAELLEATPMTEQQRRHVQVFRESGSLLHELINDLLDFSRIEAGRFELDLAPFSLHELLEQQLALQGPKAAAKGLQLLLHCAADVSEGVIGDRRRLQQALTNLVGNAIKFSLVGGVRIDVARGAGSDEVVFAVSDTGIGIVPSKLELIFEPFSQADGSVTRHFGGTGLGLSITRSIAQLMHGRIEVRSVPGQGSVFTLTAPLARCQLPPRAPDRAAGFAAADGTDVSAARPVHAVLLAEDNEVNVYIFESMLAGQALRIDVASNGPTALEMARRTPYQLIFMDVQMPGMDGLSVTRELRRFETGSGRARTPVVALTANAFAQDVKDSQDAGCDLHLSKPFTRPGLLDALRRFLPAAAAPGAAQPTPAAPAPTVLDDAAALGRLDGDSARHARALAHAAVFLEHWPQDYGEVQKPDKVALQRGLAGDLCRVAADIGAVDLAAAAGRLQMAIEAGPSAAARSAAAREVHEALIPVIAAVTAARRGRMSG